MSDNAGPLVTVRHNEEAVELASMCSTVATRHGIDVHAEITYAPGQTREALNAVARLGRPAPPDRGRRREGERR